jgi:hypothetical protein
MARAFGGGCLAAHNASVATWYREATATWFEEMMYDYVNDYRFYIEYTLSEPYTSLDDIGIFPEGKVIWNLCLSQNFGEAIVHEIWTELEFSGDDELGAMNLVLYGYGSSLEDAFEDYCIWNWFTGIRDDGEHYEEGGTWAEAKAQGTLDQYPVIDWSPPSQRRPDHLACNYIHFDRGSGWPCFFVVQYDGPPLAEGSHSAHLSYIHDDGSSHYYREIPLNESGDGWVFVESLYAKQRLCLIVINKDRFANDMYYTVFAGDPTGVTQSPELALYPPVPNPLTSWADIGFAVGVSGSVELSIYDLRGRLVTTLFDDSLAGREATARWDGTDRAGAQVASGIYFVKLTSGGRSIQRKIAVLR